MTKDNLHSSHRKRLKNRFLQEGLESFEDHQVLELALFFAIPRKDTNPIAHRLLRRFGSLASVLNAPISELVKVEGMGEHAAIFLKMQHGLLLKYQASFYQQKLNLSSHKECMKLVHERMKYLNHEEFHVLCLDSSMRLINYLPMFKGTVNSATVNLREVTSKVLELDSSAIVMAHNHPSGVAYPSPEDLSLTESLLTALKYQDVEVLDHLICTSTNCYSMLKDNKIFELKQKINSRIPKLFLAQKTGGFTD
ncbi:MAG: DNA repair protein RadC [Clostridiales bacterium]|jgi:DNA repair protein RadC|nr:DNA repair protein RadC [Clostridiales bacterium]